MWKDMLLNAYLIVMVATLCNQWFKIRVYPPIVFMCWSSHCLFHNFSLRTQQLQNSYGSTDSKLPAYCPPPPPPPPTRPHPRHPTLGEKYKASLVWEHRDLSDTALYHGILPLSHNGTHSRTEPSSQGGSFSPLTFSEPLRSLAWRTNNTLYSKTHKPQSKCEYADMTSALSPVHNV